MSTDSSTSSSALLNMTVDAEQHRFPFSIVWTPIPIISWLLPFVGHMGIATSRGVIRDFAGSYYVSEDDMGFGWPTMYWQLSPDRVPGGAPSWDQAVYEASEEYKSHMHNLFCDNCHSHVALALNRMRYGGSTRWGVIKLCLLTMLRGKYVSIWGFLKQWLPFAVIAAAVTGISIGFSR